MNCFEYRQSTNRTMNTDLTHKEKLSMLCMGLTGEAGEVSDLYKKYLYHGHELDRGKVTEELGDVLFYLDQIANSVGVTLEFVMQYNDEKRNTRYKKGFSVQASIQRVDVHGD